MKNCWSALFLPCCFGGAELLLVRKEGGTVPQRNWTDWLNRTEHRDVDRNNNSNIMMIIINIESSRANTLRIQRFNLMFMRFIFRMVFLRIWEFISENCNFYWFSFLGFLVGGKWIKCPWKSYHKKNQSRSDEKWKWRL